MLDYKTRELFETTFTRLRWLAIAMLGSLFIVAVVVEIIHWFVPFTGFAGDDSFSSPFVYVLLVTGLADLLFLPFFRRGFLAERPGATPANLISRMRVITILSLAVAQAPAILGIVIFLMLGVRWAFYVLWGGALVAMLAYFPRQMFWEEWVEGGGRMEV
ncbi:MAG: hypothetical protein HUU38_28225 [Anaerolineales bacterium]|jgi:hypothetical protein|nr:hypothetical protein [Anaerolineales bacterium]